MRRLWTCRYLLAGAGRELRRNAARSALALSCVALGVGGNIAATNYVQAARARLLGQLQELGTNVMVVLPKQRGNVAARARAGSAPRPLTEAAYRAVRARVAGLGRASALASLPARAQARGFVKAAGIVGCEPDYFAIKSWAPLAGALFDQGDLRRSGRVAVLGYRAATDLFGTAELVGERLLINRIPFEIIGVLAERGAGRDLSEEDQQIFVPLTTALRRLQNTQQLSGLVFEVSDSGGMAAAIAEVSRVLNGKRRDRGAGALDFDVQNQQALVEQQLAASARLSYLVRWINLSALVLAGCGVLTITWVTVLHRRREVGTRRALGATAGEVFLQFACESLWLAAGGCALGLGLGWSATRALLAQAGLPSLFDLPSALVAALSAAALSVVFAALPAWRAARLTPAGALASS